MSVTAANIVDVSYTRDDEGVRTYTCVVESVTDSLADHARVVVLDVIARWPFGTPYVYGNDADPWCFARWPKDCKIRSVDKSRMVWRTTLDFTNKPIGKKCSEVDIEDPVDEPPKISGSFVSRMKAATKDRNGNPIHNSSDEPVIPAPEVDDPGDTVIIEVNTQTINLAMRSAYRNRCNNATFWGLGKRTIRLAQWSYSLEYYGACHLYFANLLEFEVNLEKWDFVYLDQGFRIKNGVDGAGNTKYTTLMDDRDQPLREPRLLDGSGALLAAAGAEVELTAEIIDEADFSALPVPDPLW